MNWSPRLNLLYRGELLGSIPTTKTDFDYQEYIRSRTDVYALQDRHYKSLLSLIRTAWVLLFLGLLITQLL